MWLIVGLGNPGSQYRRTRHNAGFMVLDRAADRWGGGGFRVQGESLALAATVAGHEVVLLKPQTYMNRSGPAVGAAMRYHAAAAPTLVVVYDDFHLPLGRLRLREGGSAGGHHGMESIIRQLGSEAFLRLRLGIADEGLGADAAGFVLEPFPRGAAAVVEEMIDRGVLALESLIQAGASRTMSLFN